MKKCLYLAVAAAATIVNVPEASAREFGDITRPYLAKHGDWKKARGALLRQLKRGQSMSGDDWFVLAAMCDIVPPSGPSVIRNMINGSPCREEVIEYFVNAGMNGTPHGFERAAFYVLRRGGTAQQAWPYFALAERFAGRDPDLQDDLRELQRRMSGGLTEAQRLEVNATAMKLVADGVYRGSASTASAQQGYRSPPPIDRSRTASPTSGNLAWLDFVDASKCEWSPQANAVFSDSIRWNSSGTRALPATLRVQGVPRPVTSRLVRQPRNRATELDVYVDFDGRWNGLQVLGLTRTFIERSDAVNSFGLRFREPVREVAARLRAVGFLVNADGSTRDSSERRVERWAGPDGGGSVEVIDGAMTRIFRRGGETVFHCDRVYEEGSP